MTHELPDDLAVYDLARFYDNGGSRAYFLALIRAGVSRPVAETLRSDAAVADVRESRRRRMAYGSCAR